jgi:hypothetical protein
MRNVGDENGLWAAIDMVLKSKLPAKDLDTNRYLA